MDFKELFERATGFQPYIWQVELATRGLPETLEVPTGCGKTAAVVGTWVHRRRFHNEEDVRTSTPRRLVLVLPMRTLVEQTADTVRAFLARLDGDVPQVVVLMGGERLTTDWRLNPHVDAVIVGTLDMILSRTLNRGYGASRYSWPIDFGLLNNDCHYVFDEVQLMGPAVTTGRQLQALRESLGTASPCRSTWMSATLDSTRLVTVDAPEVPEPFRLEPPECASIEHHAVEPVRALQLRLDAQRSFKRWIDPSTEPKQRDAARAGALVDAHEDGTLTLAVHNTVEAARRTFDAIGKVGFDGELILLHSRFRPADRAAALERVLADPQQAGTIVVSTQVVEAGMDLSATTLATEVAPWSSVVQRAGRCNRDGLATGATVMWDTPSSHLPYPEQDLRSTEAALDTLVGAVVSTSQLAAMDVEESHGPEPLVLRRRDLLGLFDTTPDLSGNDLDIGPYLRDDDLRDVLVCWRYLGDDGLPDSSQPPARDELCSVPLGEFRKWMVHRSVFRLDHIGSGLRVREAEFVGRSPWIRCNTSELRPGQVYLVDCSEGGYSAQRGWDPKLKATVLPPDLPIAANEDLAPTDEVLDADPASFIAQRVELSRHLEDVEDAVTVVLAKLKTPGLSEEMRGAAVSAGRWHDLGKAHDVFQCAMREAIAPIPAAEDVLWAKSGTHRRVNYKRRYFRHELASALALLGDGGVVLDGRTERDLVVYLVASHHGRVRMSIRSVPDEPPEDNGRRRALGVCDGDRLPSVTVGSDMSPELRLDLAPMEIGSTDQQLSWSQMTAGLRDRDDLGPFRLAFLESLVRGSDWLVSSAYETAACDTEVTR